MKMKPIIYDSFSFHETDMSYFVTKRKRRHTNAAEIQLASFLEDNLIPDLVFATDMSFFTCVMLTKRLYQTYMTLLSSKTMK